MFSMTTLGFSGIQKRLLLGPKTVCAVAQTVITATAQSMGNANIQSPYIIALPKHFIA